MSRIHLTDRQWAFMQPLLPPPARTGRPHADDRRTIEAIFYVLLTGCRWQDLPHEYGAPTTAWRRLKRWGEEGIWERIWRAALATLDCQGQLDWTMAFLDGSFVPAKWGGEKVGLTRKGKGTKWMLVVGGNGLPLGFYLDGADCTEVQLAQQTLDTIQVTRPRGRPKRRPAKLVADRGYDSRDLRQFLRRCGIRRCIPVRHMASQARSSHRRTEGGRAAAVQSGTELRLIEQFPAPRYPLGTLHCYSVYRSGCAFAVMLRCVAVCAPSDCPRVPDPVGVRRARAVSAAVYAA